MLITVVPFYFALLEQYYTGMLILQYINGVDEGSLVYVGFCFISGFYGSYDLWTA